MADQSTHRFLNLSPSQHNLFSPTQTPEDSISAAVVEATDASVDDVQQKPRRSSSILTTSTEGEKDVAPEADKAPSAFAQISTFLKNGH